jgi:hypothetical protein
VESTEPKQEYGVKLDFVSERTIKDHHHHQARYQGAQPLCVCMYVDMGYANTSMKRNGGLDELSSSVHNSNNGNGAPALNFDNILDTNSSAGGLACSP